MNPLLAVHLSDGILQPLWVGAAYIPAVLLIAWSLFGLREEEIPRIALLSAAFFVATLIHIRTGPTSVHLLLNGPLGLILDRRAVIAIALGLVLQCFLLGHGGVSTLGLNLCIIALPALFARPLFQALRSLSIPTGLSGFLLGACCVSLSAFLNALILVLAGIESFQTVAVLVLLAHLSVAFFEGFVIAGLASYFAKVKPEFLGIKPKPTPPAVSEGNGQ